MPTHTLSTGPAEVKPRTLGERIQKARDDLGIGQAEMARRVGVVTTTAWRWEHDRSAPRPSDLERLAEVLRVPKEWLESGVMPDPPKGTTVETNAA